MHILNPVPSARRRIPLLLSPVNYRLYKYYRFTRIKNPSYEGAPEFGETVNPPAYFGAALFPRIHRDSPTVTTAVLEGPRNAGRH